MFNRGFLLLSQQPSASAQLPPGVGGVPSLGAGGSPLLPGGASATIQFRQPSSYSPSSSLYNPYFAPTSISAGGAVLTPYQQYLAAVAAAAAASTGCGGNMYAAAMDPTSTMQQQLLQQQLYFPNLVQYQTQPTQIMDPLAAASAGSGVAGGAAANAATNPHPSLYVAAMGCSTDAESIATSEVFSLEESSTKSPDSSIDGQAPQPPPDS